MWKEGVGVYPWQRWPWVLVLPQIPRELGSAGRGHGDGVQAGLELAGSHLTGSGSENTELDGT